MVKKESAIKELMLERGELLIENRGLKEALANQMACVNELKHFQSNSLNNKVKMAMFYSISFEFYEWLLLRSETKELQEFAPFKRFTELFEGK
jgi:hypothetical protein